MSTPTPTGLQAVNIRRSILVALQAWGTTNGVIVKVRSVRAPLDDDEDEAVILRYGVYRRRPTRVGQYKSVQVVEFHCLSKRGDLRTDQLTDRTEVLASMIEAEFQYKDLNVVDHVGSDPDTSLGVLQFLRGSWRNADSRGTIHGENVDYTLETPKVEHTVVSYTATLNTG